MVRENMRSPRAVLHLFSKHFCEYLLQSGLALSGFDSRARSSIVGLVVKLMVAISPPSSGLWKQAPLAPGSIPGRCTRVYIRRLDGMLPAWLAQSVERTTLNRVVAGSSPASGALCLSERHAELALCLSSSEGRYACMV